MSAASANQRSSDDDDRDGRQEESVPHPVESLTAETAEHDPDETGAYRTDNISADHGRPDGNAGETRGSLIASDCIQAPAKGRAAEEQGRENEKRSQEPQDRREARQSAGHQPSEYGW